MNPENSGILVINRACRTDRRAWMQIAVDALTAQGWDARIAEACDKNDIQMQQGCSAGDMNGVEHRSYQPPWSQQDTVAGLERDFDALGRKFWDGYIEHYYARPVNAGEVALVHSNLKCLQLGIECGWRWTLILEDDCAPLGLTSSVAGKWDPDPGQVATAWCEVLQKLGKAVDAVGEQQCHMVNLGPLQDFGDGVGLGEEDGIVAPSRYMWGTHSIAYSHSGAEWLLERSPQLLGAAVAWDDMLTCLYLGPLHPLEWLRELWKHYAHGKQELLKAFTVCELITTQLENYDVDGSVVSSDIS